jgi:hypothetical protein
VYTKGAPALHDFFNIFQIALGVNSPATPVTLNLGQQTFALPSKECGAGDIETAANIACFIFYRTVAFHHGTLSAHHYDTNITTFQSQFSDPWCIAVSFHFRLQ